jgi:hypothetical protein
VRVEDDGERGAGRREFAIDDGRRGRTPGFEQARIEAAALHHPDDMRRVAADVLAVGGDVRYREQFDELAQDAVLVGAPVVPHRIDGAHGRRRRHAQRDGA